MITLTPTSRPRLASKAKLRLDRRTGRTMLLYPEKGLVLSPTATEILKLCTGEWTVAGIVAALAARYTDQPAVVIEREVVEFLGAMAARGLVDGAP